MRNILKRSLTLFMALVLVCTTSTVALAASKPKAPKKITTKQGVYYDYVKKHNIEGGDCYSIKINWSSVSKAAGYKVKLYWQSEETTGIQTINVTKKNGKYYYTVSKASSGMMYHCYKNTAALVKGGMMVSDKKKITFFSSKLSFCAGGGSSERVYKIVVKSYKKVNGKKVYSKAKIKNLKQAW